MHDGSRRPPPTVDFAVAHGGMHMCMECMHADRAHKQRIELSPFHGPGDCSSKPLPPRRLCTRRGRVYAPLRQVPVWKIHHRQRGNEGASRCVHLLSKVRKRDAQFGERLTQGCCEPETLERAERSARGSRGGRGGGGGGAQAGEVNAGGPGAEEIVKVAHLVEVPEGWQP